MTLLEANVGEAMRVVDESACDDCAQSLALLGIHRGDLVRLVQRAPFHGPLLIEVLGTGIRVALGRGMAARLEVAPADG